MKIIFRNIERPHETHVPPFYFDALYISKINGKQGF